MQLLPSSCRRHAVIAGVLACLLVLGACSAQGAPSPTSSAPAPSPATLPSGAVVDYQLGGAYRPASDVTVVVRDRTEAPDASRYSICYVNAFQTQPGSLSWWKQRHPTLLLKRKGALVRDPGWPDEVLLDQRTAAKRAELTAVVAGWFRSCAKAGYDAIEADNLDAWTRSRGLLTKAQTVSTARALVKAAHTAGLAIAQKNTPEVDGRALGFDFAVAEECEVYRECGAYTGAYGGAVVEIEYTDNGRSAYTRACKARAGDHPILLRDRDVVPRGTRGYVFRHC
ncbi:endo alpha-1,4 polygalactosaminidase [Aeromicrobium sp.]|uniref:endo alpha-1,4 polygalactosaminidase n=1 Tax=Aeromicrobium sp. TaxID=1871063 RepID=UPI0040338CAC